MRMVVILLLLMLVSLSSGCIVNLYSPDAVIKQASELSGKMISIRGELKMDDCICTMMDCPPENPCCNSCDCSLVFSGKSGKITLLNRKCSTKNCETVCGIEPGKVMLEGSFVDSDGEYLLTVK